MTHDETRDFGGFAKLYGDKLTTSSLLLEPVATRWVFLWMLAKANAEGFFRCSHSPRVLARIANITEEQAGEAIRILEAPDPDSQSKEEDGRRIIPVDGGWHLTTYEKHREFRTRETAASANRMRKYRERKKEQGSATVTPVTLSRSQKQKQKQMSDAEVRGQKKEREKSPSANSLAHARIFNHWNEHQALTTHRSLSDKTKQSITARLSNGFNEADIIRAITRYAELCIYGRGPGHNNWTLNQLLSRESGNYLDIMLKPEYEGIPTKEDRDNIDPVLRELRLGSR